MGYHHTVGYHHTIDYHTRLSYIIILNHTSYYISISIGLSPKTMEYKPLPNGLSIKIMIIILHGLTHGFITNCHIIHIVIYYLGL